MHIENLKIHKDSRGSLIPIELDSLPFTSKRIFTVMNVPTGEWRGEHAHYETEQIIACLHGNITVCFENKNGSTEFCIQPGECVYHGTLEWGRFKFNVDNSIMMVLCSTPHDESDYIRDYSKFKKLIEE